MKFRCERDDLVEALGTAGRAVANRGGALPVLLGVRLELSAPHADRFCTSLLNSSPRASKSRNWS